jgi:hypothetical protein
MHGCSDILKVRTNGLEAFRGSPGVLERLIRREDLRRPGGRGAVAITRFER